MSNQSNSFPLAFRMFSSKQKFILIATAVLWAIILIVLIGGLMNVMFGEASRLLRIGLLPCAIVWTFVFHDAFKFSAMGHSLYKKAMIGNFIAIGLIPGVQIFRFVL